MNNLLDKVTDVKLYSLIDRIKEIRIKKIKDRNSKKIIRYSIYIKDNITNDNVVKYITFINDIEIPNRMICENTIIDVYKNIKDNDNIRDSLKSDLRILLGCKGISFTY